MIYHDILSIKTILKHNINLYENVITQIHILTHTLQYIDERLNISIQLIILRTWKVELKASIVDNIYELDYLTTQLTALQKCFLTQHFTISDYLVFTTIIYQ